MLKLIENSRWFGICGLVCLLCMAGCAKPEDEDNDSTDVEQSDPRKGGAGNKVTTPQGKKGPQKPNSPRAVAKNQTKKGGPHNRSRKTGIVKGSCQLNVSCPSDGTAQNDCESAHGGHMCVYVPQVVECKISPHVCEHVNGYSTDLSGIKVTNPTDGKESTPICVPTLGATDHGFAATPAGNDGCKEVFVAMRGTTQTDCDDLRIIGAVGAFGWGAKRHANTRRQQGKNAHKPDGTSKQTLDGHPFTAWFPVQQWCRSSIASTPACNQISNPCKGKKPKACASDNRCKVVK